MRGTITFVFSAKGAGAGRGKMHSGGANHTNGKRFCQHSRGRWGKRKTGQFRSRRREAGGQNNSWIRREIKENCTLARTPAKSGSAYSLNEKETRQAFSLPSLFARL